MLSKNAVVKDVFNHFAKKNNIFVNPFEKFDNESNTEVFYEIARQCAEKTYTHPKWATMAGNILTYILHKDLQTIKKWALVFQNQLDPGVCAFVAEHHLELETMIDHSRDYGFDFFAISTLKNGYLLKNGEYMETPQHMYMRVAIFLNAPSLAAIKETYDTISKGLYTHATPTMFNAGTKRPQCASCFLVSVGDTTRHITDNWANCANISRMNGGIGCDYSKIRHSQVGNYGQSSGIIPLLKTKNSILKMFDQGGKRPGAETAFLNVAHIDIFDFIKARSETTPDDMRAADLFYCVWVPDLFMRRLEQDGDWHLFCPNKTSLFLNWGSEFDKVYKKDVEERRYEKVVKARELWTAVIDAQFETGMPFVVFQDTTNFKCNQKNLGMIRSSNLCLEITEVTDDDKISTCNLASICVNRFVCLDGDRPVYNFKKLGEVASLVCRNLNNVIDRTYYPPEVPQIEPQNRDLRPLGIGIQGLADAIAKMDYTWESDNAKELNRAILETIYFYSMKESLKLVDKYGAYKGFNGSPLHRGHFQFDLHHLDEYRRAHGLSNDYGSTFNPETYSHPLISEKLAYNWAELRNAVKERGVANSLLVALMPTASTAQILGNNECFEPFTSNIYSRTVLSGNYIVINKHLVRDMEDLGAWSENFAIDVLKNEGSIQSLDPKQYGIEDLERFNYIKKKYKTAFELKQRLLIDYASDRSAFVCQSQSLNLWFSKPSFSTLYASILYGWKKGLKTGMYYLREKERSMPINVALKKTTRVCTDDVCIACSS